MGKRMTQERMKKKGGKDKDGEKARIGRKQEKEGGKKERKKEGDREGGNIGKRKVETVKIERMETYRSGEIIKTFEKWQIKDGKIRGKDEYIQ